MKKKIQIAFAISLVFLSAVSTFVNTELFSNIVLGIAIPSFLLTVISFLDSIIAKCKGNSAEFADVLRRIADAELWISEHSSSESQTAENTQQISEESKSSPAHAKEYIAYETMRSTMEKYQTILEYATLVSYVMLFLSLILSPYLVRLLSKVNLNFITLWSLTILYVDAELKYEVTSKSFDLLVRHFVKNNRRTKG